MKCYLYDQWIQEVKKFLLDKKITIKGIKNEDIPIYYHEYLLRTFGCLPHNVFISKELQKNPKYKKYFNVITKICDKASLGEDINMYLSKGIKNIKKSDKMLNEWGVMHFHLGNKLNADGFIERTGDLLFIYRDISNPQDLYVLDIFNHQDWYRKRIIKILTNNWEKFKLKRHPYSLCYKINTKEHKKLRSNNINTVVPLGNEIFIDDVYGLTSKGTCIASVEFRNKCKRGLDKAINKLLNINKISMNRLKIIQRKDGKFTIKVNLDVFIRPHFYDFY